MGNIVKALLNIISGAIFYCLYELKRVKESLFKIFYSVTLAMFVLPFCHNKKDCFIAEHYYKKV